MLIVEDLARILPTGEVLYHHTTGGSEKVYLEHESKTLFLADIYQAIPFDQLPAS